MPLILGTNSIKDTGYDVANSCMFNDGDSAYMHKTFASGGTETAWTISMWVKRGALGTDQRVFSCDDSSDGDPDNYWRFTDDDEIQINIYNGSAIGNLITTRVFRDCSAWYHVCVIWKSADGTEGDRIQLWINGIRETSFSTETYPSQNAVTVTSSQVVAIGRRNYAGEQYFDGYLAEVVFLDGVTASPVGTLGEFDEDSPTIFKPKDPSGLTFGTNGFYLDFEDSANLGNDANGGTDFTEVNLAATDQMTDSPTNNFATLNPLNKGTGTFSEGNLGWAGDSNWRTALSTIAVAKGKWYAEFKWSSGDYKYIGINGIDTLSHDTTDAIGNHTPSISHPQSGVKFINGASTSYGDAYDGTSGLIIGVAMDLDNHNLYFSHNNTWQNSGDPESGATGTGAITIATTDTYYAIGCSDYNGLEYANYGSPPYANSSDAADANGYGAFEYAPPSGYYALCTKNLAEFG